MAVDPLVRAEIAELELRIRTWVREELTKKADEDEFQEVRKSRPSDDRIRLLIREEMDKAENKTWSGRERLMGVVLFILAFLPLISNFLIIKGKLPG